MSTTARRTIEVASEAWADRKHFQEETAKAKAKSDRRMDERQAISDGINAIFQEYRNAYFYTNCFCVKVRTRELKKLMRKYRHYKPTLDSTDFRVEKVKISLFGVKVFFKKAASK